MELELGLALPNNDLINGIDRNDDTSSSSSSSSSSSLSRRKRGFDETGERTTLPFFEQKGRGNDDKDDDSDHQKAFSKVLVGWPPIKRSGSRGGGSSGRAAIYVKVRMEGAAIGRKVDLSLCNSYEALFRTLDRMFPNRPNDGKTCKHTPNNRHHCVVTYEDGDGDWMLVGDVPWEAFIRSVKRLKIHN